MDSPVHLWGMCSAAIRPLNRKCWIFGHPSAGRIIPEKKCRALNVLKGDVNGDTLVNAVDALYILQAAVGKRTFTPEEKQYADLNGDGLTNALDALQVLRIAVHKA